MQDGLVLVVVEGVAALAAEAVEVDVLAWQDELAWLAEPVERAWLVAQVGPVGWPWIRRSENLGISWAAISVVLTRYLAAADLIYLEHKGLLPR